MKDLKLIFDWAEQNGDVKVIDRILIKLLPVMLKHNVQLTESMIKGSNSVEVSDALYEEVLKMAVSLVGMPFDGSAGGHHV